MALPGAYAQYNNSKVLTASPAELTLMLSLIHICYAANFAHVCGDSIRVTIRIRKLLLICKHNVPVILIFRILNSYGENENYEQDHAA